LVINVLLSIVNSAAKVKLSIIFFCEDIKITAAVLGCSYAPYSDTHTLLQTTIQVKR